MSVDNGGPAFGNVISLDCVRVEMDGTMEYEPTIQAGNLTVRDYFAAHASDSDIKHWEDVLRLRSDHRMLPDGWRAIARYMHADAMIAARGKK